MVKCNDYWYEHYDKNKGNCAQCIKNEPTRNKSVLSTLLKKTAIKQIEFGKKIKTNGQNR